MSGIEKQVCDSTTANQGNAGESRRAQTRPETGVFKIQYRRQQLAGLGYHSRLACGIKRPGIPIQADPPRHAKLITKTTIYHLMAIVCKAYFRCTVGFDQRKVQRIPLDEIGRASCRERV